MSDPLPPAPQPNPPRNRKPKKKLTQPRATIVGALIGGFAVVMGVVLAWYLNHPPRPPIIQTNCIPTAAELSAVIRAAQYGNIEDVKRYLERGCNPDIVVEGHTLLRDAVGDLQVTNVSVETRLNLIQLILDHKADINLQARNGETPLYTAVVKASLDLTNGSSSKQIVEFLLKHQANPNIRTTRLDKLPGETPLAYASNPRFRTNVVMGEIVALLKEYGAQ